MRQRIAIKTNHEHPAIVRSVCCAPGPHGRGRRPLWFPGSAPRRASAVDRRRWGRGRAADRCSYRGSRCGADSKEADTEADTEAPCAEADTTAACAADTEAEARDHDAGGSAGDPAHHQAAVYTAAEPGRMPGSGAQRQQAVRCRGRALRLRHELLSAGVRLQRRRVRGVVPELSMKRIRRASLNRYGRHAGTGRCPSCPDPRAHRGGPEWPAPVRVRR